MNSYDIPKYGIPVGVCDWRVSVRAAVDNLIKITAGENGPRYSRTLTAYNNVTG